ncbi:MAG: heavy metal translocating P-type ATPase [Eubacteriaceae bacterium]|nr:heavy metal translocating P-type ATPase [Eubacteriaceae bacterium]
MKTTIAISMYSTSQALAIEKSLNSMKGIKSASVSFIAGKASIEYDQERLSPDEIAGCIETLGFDACEEFDINAVSLELDSKVGISKAESLKKALLSTNGILSASIKDGSSSLSVEYTPKSITLSDIRLIASASQCYVLNANSASSESFSDRLYKNSAKSLKLRMALALAASLPVIYLASWLQYDVAFIIIPNALNPLINPLNYALAQMVFSMLAAAVSWPFFKRAFKCANARLVSSDTVSLAPLAALFSLSIYETAIIIMGGAGAYSSLAFEAFCAFLILSHAIQLANFTLALALRNRLSIKAPSHAVVENGDYTDILPINELKEGVIASIAEGALAPCDGILIDCEGLFAENEFFTPNKQRSLAQGDIVYMGSVNKGSKAKIACIGPASSSFLAKAYSMLSGSSYQRSSAFSGLQIANIALIVLAFAAAGALAAMQGIESACKAFSAIAGILMSFPVLLASSLQTLAVLIGNAKNMVFMQSAAQAEALAKTKAFIFDPSAIFSARPQLTEFKTVKGADSREVLQLAASAEALSNHRHAKAIVRLAQKKGISLLPPSKFSEHEEGGVSAVIGSTEVAVGTSRLMDSLGLSPSGIILPSDRDTAEKSCILISNGPKIVGKMVFVDRIKKNAPESIKRLGSQGAKSILYSSYENSRASELAQKAGIGECFEKEESESKAGALSALAEGRKPAAIVSGAYIDGSAAENASASVAFCSAESLGELNAGIYIANGGFAGLSAAHRAGRQIASRLGIGILLSYSAFAGYAWLALAKDASPTAIACLAAATGLVISWGWFQLSARLKKPHSAKQAL